MSILQLLQTVRATFPSLKLEKEGWLCGQTEGAKLPCSAQTGAKRERDSAIARSRKCGQIGEIFRPEGFADLTTPSAPSKVASRHLV